MKFLPIFLFTAVLPVLAADLAPKPEETVLVDTLDIAPAWSGHPVGFALLTHPPYQFVAFYDAERRLTVARRKLSERKWEFTLLPVTTGWDSHNYITMTADDGGYLHLSGDMHCVPLKYFRTTKPLDPSTFERVENMVGTEETRATYPRFLRGPRQELIFTYRDGGSGNGAWSLSGLGTTASGYGSCECGPCQCGHGGDQRSVGQYPYGGDVGAHTTDRNRTGGPTHDAHPIWPRNVRSGSDGPRAGKIRI